MDFVPHPVGTMPGMSYILKTLRQIGKAIVYDGGGIYRTCKTAISGGYARVIQIAMMGL